MKYYKVKPQYDGKSKRSCGDSYIANELYTAREVQRQNLNLAYMEEKEIYPKTYTGFSEHGLKTAHRIVTDRESEVRKMKTLITRLINTVCDADKSNVSAMTKFLRRNISVGMMVKLDSLTK